MNDRLGELLNRHEILAGIICRDPTLTDIELIALAGYHVVWLDCEHGPITTPRAIELSRTVLHLGMAPLIRIIELTRTQVQTVLDGGCPIVLLPDVRDANQAQELVRLGKYPPTGQRGVSTSAAGVDFDLGQDLESKLRQVNGATHLMAQFESNQGFENLEAICAVKDIDMVTVGPGDWAVGAGLFGKDTSALAPKVDRVLSSALAAGKITAMGVGNVEQAAHYAQLGVRILFAGVDVNLKRQAFSEALKTIKPAP